LRENSIIRTSIRKDNGQKLCISGNHMKSYLCESESRETSTPVSARSEEKKERSENKRKQEERKYRAGLDVTIEDHTTTIITQAK
jgi:hypothetical protein